MSIWKTQTRCADKPWGGVVHIKTPFGMNGKIIYMKKGHRTSLKYYANINQALYCLSGKITANAPRENEFGDEISEAGSKFFVEPGELLLIQGNNPYRLTAVEDSVLVEVLLGSNNDSTKIMIEDDYGRIVKEDKLKPPDDWL